MSDIPEIKAELEEIASLFIPEDVEGVNMLKSQIAELGRQLRNCKQVIARASVHLKGGATIQSVQQMLESFLENNP